MVLRNVEVLSGDEGGEENGPSLPKPPSKPSRMPRRGFKRTLKIQQDNVDPLTLRRLVSSKCGCKCQCFKPFNGSQRLFDEFVTMRKNMRDMTKLEKDNHVMP